MEKTSLLEKSKHYANLDAVNPFDGKTWKVFLSYDKMKFIGSLGPAYAKTLAFVVPQALTAPMAIFSGLRDEGTEGWCYVGLPDRSFPPRKQGDPDIAPGNEVFVVLVNEDRVMLNWRWVERDANDADLPIGYLKSFGKRLI